MLFLARGIEDDHYWVVREVNGVLVDADWRIEEEADGWRASHADDADLSRRAFALGPFATAQDAVDGLRELGNRIGFLEEGT
jgi:hypothetical protein